MLLADASIGDGQDVLIIRTANGKKTKRSGQIISWKGDAISILAGSRTRSVNSKDVIELQSNWPAELKLARANAAANDHQAAIKNFRSAKSKETRAWVRSIINSEMIQSLDAMENVAASVQLFLEIYNEDPESRFFKLIPLSWSVGELNPPSSAQSKLWLNDENPVAQLIGASWQLNGSTPESRKKLESLTNHSDKRIAQLAIAQLWRIRTWSAPQSEVERWEKQVDRIALELRAGPLIAVAMAQKRLRLHDQAKINFLKVPILYSQKKSLSAFALFQSGSIMEDNGEQDQAKSVWRELFRDYPASQFGEFARGKL